MASEKALKQKEELVKALAERMKSAKVIILTDYRGINVADVTKLRADLRNTNSEYKFIKNNILNAWKYKTSKNMCKNRNDSN